MVAEATAEATEDDEMVAEATAEPGGQRTGESGRGAG